MDFLSHSLVYSPRLPPSGFAASILTFVIPSGAALGGGVEGSALLFRRLLAGRFLRRTRGCSATGFGLPLIARLLRQHDVQVRNAALVTKRASHRGRTDTL